MVDGLEQIVQGALGVGVERPGIGLIAVGAGRRLRGSISRPSFWT
ncbi:hypothetical protein ACFQQB_18750 [Nonomuraea rubra]